AKEPLAAIERGRARIRETKDLAGRTDASLRALESQVRAGTLDPRAVRDAIQVQSFILAQLCFARADDASRAGDAAQNKLFLDLAARLDPRGADAYRAKQPVAP